MYVGVVVLYNPVEQEVIKNINTYVEQLDSLLIVDNSTDFNSSIKDYFSGNNSVHYEFLEGNKGIAFALNRGIAFARKLKARWLLTMDQDSYFTHQEFSQFIKFMDEKSIFYKDAVIFSPVHQVPYLEKPEKVTKVNTVMTSGNFINMNLIDKVGCFQEELFIDSVDHEYCYRINKLGYSVYRLHCVQLEHNLGELHVKKLFGKKLFITNHNYIRRYYITRNSLYVVKKYSKTQLGFLRYAIESIFWSLFTITLYENSKKLKIKSVVLGLIDYKRGMLGEKSL